MFWRTQKTRWRILKHLNEMGKGCSRGTEHRETYFVNNGDLLLCMH